MKRQTYHTDAEYIDAMMKQFKLVDMREQYRDRCLRLPMREEARSLNLSNSVAVIAYEALRQQNFPGLTGRGEMAESRE